MILLSLSSNKQQHHPRRRGGSSSKATVSSSFSSSPSFWISRVIGALLISPPETIERWLPMVAPFPKTIVEIEQRCFIDEILKDCWDDDFDSDCYLPAGYDVDDRDEWIVDNQRQNRNQLEATEIDNNNNNNSGAVAVRTKDEPLIPSRKSPNTNGGQQQQQQQQQQQYRDTTNSAATTTATPPTKANAKANADSLFSNYFLSLHLLFSLPSFGDGDGDGDDGDGDGDVGNGGIDKGGTLGTPSFKGQRNTALLPSATTLKPSTYGEITPLGARQLFGAMGLFDTSSIINNAQTDPVRFVDLGSGTGKLVGQVFLELPSTIATGVELSPSRHQSAMRARLALIETLKLPREQQQTTTRTTPIVPQLPRTNYNNNDIGVIDEPIEIDETRFELIEGDLFDVDLSSTTHIYVASLCFPDNLMLRLEERLCQRIARQKQQQQQQQNKSSSQAPQDRDPTNGNNENETKTTTSTKSATVATLCWVATLRRFPNNLGGIVPQVRFMEMSWTKPLGCAVYLYRCDGEG